MYSEQMLEDIAELATLRLKEHGIDTHVSIEVAQAVMWAESQVRYEVPGVTSTLVACRIKMLVRPSKEENLAYIDKHFPIPQTEEAVSVLEDLEVIDGLIAEIDNEQTPEADS